MVSSGSVFLFFLQLYDDYGVEGEMSIPNQGRSKTLGEPDFNTLDEPIRDTVVSLQNFNPSKDSPHF